MVWSVLKRDDGSEWSLDFEENTVRVSPDSEFGTEPLQKTPRENLLIEFQ